MFTWAVLLKFLRANWQAIAGVLATVLVGLMAYNWAHDRGYQEGVTEVQEKWAAQELAEFEASQKLAEAARAKEEADRKVAQEIEDELRQDLSDRDAYARGLAQRLRDYEAARDRERRLSAAACPAPGADGASGESGSDGAIGQAVEEVLAAAARDAERLNAWIQWYQEISGMK